MGGRCVVSIMLLALYSKLHFLELSRLEASVVWLNIAGTASYVGHMRVACIQQSAAHHHTLRAPNNFNKSLSKTSTVALDPDRVPRRPSRRTMNQPGYSDSEFHCAAILLLSSSLLLAVTEYRLISPCGWIKTAWWRPPTALTTTKVVHTLLFVKKSVCQFYDNPLFQEILHA